MTRKLHLVVLTFLAGCASASAAEDHVGASSSDDLAVSSYNASFRFTAPEPCDVFMVRRLVDTREHAAEYDLHLNDGGAGLSLIYSVTPSDPNLPIEAKVTTSGGRTLFSIRMNDESLSLLDPSGLEALRVVGFTTPGGGVATSGAAKLAASDSLVLAGLRALRCVLPAQKELGFVPPFMLNRSDGARTGDGVTAHSADAPPLVPWSARVTILGALWAAAAGLQPSHDGAAFEWHPQCDAKPNPLMGPACVP